MYVDRFLQDRIVEALSLSPVVVLQGARSVGKTALVRRLREQGHLAAVVSLTDASTRHIAQQDLQGWLRELPQPFAIDEAQLLPELPLALKNYLDDTGDGLQALLTGSAQIGRTGFGGSDPLAGRTRTFALPSLTEAELHSGGEEWSVTDHPLRESQLRAHSSWSQTRVGLWHWRHIQHGRSTEVDLVLEDRSVGLVGIEVESTSSVRTGAFKGLCAMKEYYGSRFRRGFVVTSNAAATPLGENLWTIPADAFRTRAAWS